MRFSYIVYFFALSLLSSCKQQYRFSFFSPATSCRSLHILIPQAVQCDKNIQDTFYKALHTVFTSLGYSLKDAHQDAVILKSVITKFETYDKLVSPDILLFNYHITITCEVSLVEPNGSVITKKTISISDILSKPKDPVLNDDFFYYTVERMLQSLARRAEYILRNKMLLP